MGESEPHKHRKGALSAGGLSKLIETKQAFSFNENSSLYNFIWKNEKPKDYRLKLAGFTINYDPDTFIIFSPLLLYLLDIVFD